MSADFLLTFVKDGGTITFIGKKPQIDKIEKTFRKMDDKGEIAMSENVKEQGSLSINSENIFPIIKKWLSSDHDIFFRELISNGCDAITKLKKLDEKRRNIALLITRSEDVIDSQQPTFFRVAMDVQMRAVVSDVKLQLNDSYHNLIEIEKQIIHYLNLIAYQNRIFEKVRRLKYLRDQFLLEENTDIRRVIGEKNPVWMEPQPNYRIKLSLSNLHTSEVALELIRKVMSRRKKDARGPRNVAGAIPESYLSQAGEVMDRVNLQEVFNAFAASGTHLFRFVMNYSYGKPVAEEDKLLFFCQLASQYADELDFTDHYESTSEVEYPLIYLRQNP